MADRIGLDLGGTKIEGVVLDEAGVVKMRERVATRAERGYESIIETTAALAERLLAAASGGCGATVGADVGIGVGAPGAISSRTGLLKNSNTQCLNGRDLRGDLARRLGRSLALDNDANCFALAEARLGAARGHRVVFGVILGTGVGGGIVLDGAVHRGPQRIAGEWGHHSIDPAGPQCYCGGRGCVETYLSGPALEREFRQRLGRPASAEAIAAAAAAGEDAAGAIFADYLDCFGRALANLIDILDPDMVVLGGGLSNVDMLYSLGVERVAHHVFNDQLVTPILRNQLGDSAGVIGAALLAGT